MIRTCIYEGVDRQYQVTLTLWTRKELELVLQRGLTDTVALEIKLKKRFEELHHGRVTAQCFKKFK